MNEQLVQSAELFTLCSSATAWGWEGLHRKCRCEQTKAIAFAIKGKLSSHYCAGVEGIAAFNSETQELNVCNFKQSTDLRISRKLDFMVMFYTYNVQSYYKPTYIHYDRAPGAMIVTKILNYF